MEDLPCPHHHRKLPSELNCQIYLCFNPATQRKFIWGLGWDFYAMFRQKLLIKTKRVCNPDRNFWKRTTTDAIVSRDGLHVSSTDIRTTIYAEKGFAISGKQARAGSFSGTIIYYYEVKLSPSSCCRIGFSNVTPAAGESIGGYPNSYAISTAPVLFNLCRLSSQIHPFELPADGAIQPLPKKNGTNVYGCGLVMDPNDKLAIFFTLNGTLLGRETRISPSAVDHLFPALTLLDDLTYIEANFGNDKDKPFEYNIKKCPGMGLDCF